MLQNPYRPGDRVCFRSHWRPDLLADSVSPFGTVESCGSWSCSVIFDDLPDEPIYLGMNEVRPIGGPQEQKDK